MRPLYRRGAFPDLPGGTYGHKGDAGSKKYMRWLRGTVGIKDKRLGSHSWRHRMEDVFRDIEGMPEEVADAILGHALEGQRGTYGKGHSLVTKARWIAKVPVVKV